MWFCTKAIHLEATSNLTIEIFFRAFSMLAARNGCPLILCADNGKAYVGAEKALTGDFFATGRHKLPRRAIKAYPVISALQAPPHGMPVGSRG